MGVLSLHPPDRVAPLGRSRCRRTCGSCSLFASLLRVAFSDLGGSKEPLQAAVFGSRRLGRTRRTKPPILRSNSAGPAALLATNLSDGIALLLAPGEPEADVRKRGPDGHGCG